MAVCRSSDVWIKNEIVCLFSYFRLGKNQIPERAGDVARFAIERVVMQVYERQGIAFDNAGTFLLPPRHAHILDDEINPDKRVFEKRADFFKKRLVLGVRFIGKVGGARSDSSADFLIERYQAPFVRDVLPRKLLSFQFFVGLLSGFNRVESVSVALRPFVFFLDKRLHRSEERR